jgi:hypothetical protein
VDLLVADDFSLSEIWSINTLCSIDQLASVDATSLQQKRRTSTNSKQSNFIISRLNMTRMSIPRIMVAMETSYLDSNSKILRLRLQFMEDLLPWESGMILRATLKREGFGTNTWLSSPDLSGTIKGLVWLIVICSASAMLLYIAAFVLRSDRRLGSDAWFLCLVFWACVDLLFGSTLTAFIFHIAIPSAISPDLQHTQMALVAGVVPTKVQLQSHRSKSSSYDDDHDSYFNGFDDDNTIDNCTIDDCGDDMPDLQLSSGHLNAPAFFFPSSRIAHYFSQYDTDGLISRYVSVWPGHPMRKRCALTVPIKYDDLWQSHTGFQVNDSMNCNSVVGVMGVFSWLPLWTQNLLVYELSTCLSFGIVVLHLYLASLVWWFAVVPVGVLLLASAAILMRLETKRKSRNQP